MKLYEIKEQYDRAILEGIDPETGEMLPEVFEELDKIEDSLKDKAVNVACVIKNYKASSKAIADEIAKLQARKRSMDNKAENLKDYLAHNLSSGEKIEAPMVTLSWRNSESVNILDMAALPADYTKQAEPTADKTLIKKAIKDGFDVPGAVIEKKKNLIIQ